MAADIMQRLLFFAVEHLFALIIIAALLWQLYCCVYQIRHRRRLGLSLFTTYYIPSPFPSDHTPSPPPPSSAHNTPLDPSLLHLLPTFTYSSADHSHPQPECVICQSEFEDGDKGRVLPNCNHFLFHLDCIQRWLREHSTCPLCRKVVDPPPKITLQHENTEASAGQEGQLENSSNVNLPPPIWCPKDTWQGIGLEGVVIDIPEEDHRRRQSTSLRDSES